MDDRVSRLTTARDCDKFALAIDEDQPKLAQQARQRALDLCTAVESKKYGAATDVEREIIKAICAYERVLFKKHGKGVRASYTWRSVKNNGIKGAAEKAVNRNDTLYGYQALAEIGMQNITFEAIVIKYPAEFTADALRHSEDRLNG
jgi:hypothetical protein